MIEWPAPIWWHPFTVERVSLTTSLSAEECVQRIRAKVYSFWSGGDPTLPFLGRIRHDRFTLVKNTPHFGNAFRPFAYGSIHSDAATGTTINIRLSLALPARLWWCILLGGFAVAFALSLLGAAGIFEIDPSLSQPFNVLIAAIVAGIMFYPFYLMLFWLSRRERLFLIDMLQAILHATAVLPPNA